MNIFLAIFAYYLFSRMFVIFWIALQYDDWKWAIEGTPDTPPVLMPLVGEFWLTIIICEIFFYYPAAFAGNAGGLIRSKFLKMKEKKEENKKRRDEYLNNLSKYGLTPKDIPAYIKDPAALKEYLSAWNKVNQ